MTKRNTGIPTRADAQKSVDQILVAAEAILDEDPTASLLKIAAAAGLTRVTIYRHFKSREELLETLTAKAYEAVNAVLLRLEADQVGFTNALEALTADFLDNARRMRVTANLPRGTKATQRSRQQLHDLLDRLMQKGVQEGFIST